MRCSITRPAAPTLALLALATAAAAQESAQPFDAVTQVLSYGQPRFARMLDIDGDGDLDMLGSRESFLGVAAAIYRNDGNGKLAQSWSQNGYGHHVFPAVAKFDAGPTDDFVRAETTSIHLYLGQPDGTALLASSQYFGGSSGVLGANVADTTTGDFTGDGRPDVAVASKKVIAVIEVRSDGTLVAAPADAEPIAVTTGEYVGLNALDVDGEPPLDLALTTVDAAGFARLLLYTMQPGGQLALHAIIDTQLSVDYVAYDRETTMCGDVDGDGDDDVVIRAAEKNGCVVVRRAGAGSFVADPPQAAVGGHALADLDADGALDLVGMQSVYAFQSAASYYALKLNDGTGAFAQAFLVRTGDERFGAAGDLDGDGDVDLSNGGAFYYARGPLAADPTLPAGVNQDTWDVLSMHGLHDFDRDGDPDFKTDLYSHFESDGRGAFATTKTTWVGLPAPIVPLIVGSAADWDQDDDTDLVVSAFVGADAAEDYLARNTGGGAFQWPSAPCHPGTPGQIAPANRRTIAWDGDLDGDLDPVFTLSEAKYADSLAPGGWSQSWTNLGNGTFADREVVFDSLIQAVDIDGDGLDDWLGTAQPVLGWRRNLGGGALGSFVALTPGSQFIGANVNRPAAADLDADGDVDIVHTTAQGMLHGLALLRGDGGGQFSEIAGAFDWPQYVDPSYDNDVWIADIDADGRLDVLTGNWGIVVVHRQTAAPLAFEPWLAQYVGCGELVDADGDGDLDFVGRERTTLNQLHVPPQGGAREQSGSGAFGQLGAVPRLGASGPFRVGETQRILLSGATGGTPGFLALGPHPTEIADFLFAGLTLYVHPAGMSVMPIPASGVPGLAGASHVEIPHTIPASLSGAQLYFQSFAVDLGAANGLLSASGRLHLSYGN